MGHWRTWSKNVTLQHGALKDLIQKCHVTDTGHWRTWSWGVIRPFRCLDIPCISRLITCDSSRAKFRTQKIFWFSSIPSSSSTRGGWVGAMVAPQGKQPPTPRPCNFYSTIKKSAYFEAKTEENMPIVRPKRKKICSFWGQKLSK